MFGKGVYFADVCIQFPFRVWFADSSLFQMMSKVGVMECLSWKANDVFFYLVRQLLLFSVSSARASGWPLLTLSSSLSDSVGLLLLCEVAAKPFHEETNANYNADQTCKDNKKL